MRNNDKLCLPFIIRDHTAVSFHVGIIQCRINFINETKRCGTVSHKRNKQRNNGKRPFTTGHERQRLALLSRKLEIHFYATLQRMRFIGQLQTGFAAGKHNLHNAGKFHIDHFKGIGKPFRHRFINIVNHCFQSALCFFQVFNLRFIESAAAEVEFILFFPIGIYRAEFADAFFQIRLFFFHFRHRSLNTHAFCHLYSQFLFTQSFFLFCFLRLETVDTHLTVRHIFTDN